MSPRETYTGTPTRVMDPSNGLAYCPRMAQLRGLPVPDFVLIRDDGWTLAGYDANRDECWRTWAEQWRTFARRSESWLIRPASEWGWRQGFTPPDEPGWTGSHEDTAHLTEKETGR